MTVKLRTMLSCIFFLKEGELLQSELNNDDDNFYYRMWNMADANHF